MASIEIKGVDELIRKLGKVESNKVLERPMKRSVYRLQRDMADYDSVPKMRPGEWAALTTQRQKAAYWAKVRELGRHPGRTGTLGRRWTVKISHHSNGLTGKVGNNTEYAPFVQASRFQARMHRKRWQTDREVVERNRRDIVADFEAEIRRALK